MLIGRLAEYAIREREAALPAQVIHHAKRAIVDWYAAFLPGSMVAPAKLLEQALAEDLDHGCARLASGRRATLRAAALINGAASHSLELDDIYRDAGYHPGSPIISAALAAAQVNGASGDQFLRGVIVGYEISTRIGEAVMPSHYQYWHTTGTVGSLGAAAAVASIIGCSREQFEHSLAIVTTFASGLQQAFRTPAMTKPLHSGHAAEVGAMAAMAAKQGVTGVLDIIEGEVGFGAAMSDAPDWGKATHDLGQSYNMTKMTFKSHSCCGHAFAPIDGALHLQNKYGFKWNDVQLLSIATYKVAIDITDNPSPRNAYEAKFSVQYVTAHALIYGSVRLSAFLSERLIDPNILELLTRIEVAIDAELSKGYPSRRAAYIEITLKDGRVFKHLQPNRKGDPEMPLTDSELNEKYLELVVPILGHDVAGHLLEDLWSLDKLKNVDFKFIEQSRYAVSR